MLHPLCRQLFCGLFLYCHLMEDSIRSLVQGVKPSSKLSHALATALVSCHALKPSLGLMSEYAEQGFPQTEFVAGVFIKVACRNKARFVVAMR